MASSKSKKISDVSIKSKKSKEIESNESRVVNGDMSQNLIKYGIIFMIIGYLICMILTINYALQTNIAVDDLQSSLLGVEYNQDDYHNIKSMSSGLAISVVIFVVVALVLAIVWLFIRNSSNMTIFVSYIVTFVVIVSFPIAFLALAGGINSEISKFTALNITQLNDSIDNVKMNNNNVIVTSTLGLIFSIGLIVMFVFYREPDML